MADDNGSHVTVIRAEILRLLEARPFNPFEINVENGDRIVVEHPENLAMGSGDDSGRFAHRIYVCGYSDVVFCTTFDKVSSIAEIDQGAPMGGEAGSDS